ncbi:MAG: hypothetical protein ACTS6P_02225, partial [Candidatus Hodgkinia cicadicola]
VWVYPNAGLPNATGDYTETKAWSVVRKPVVEMERDCAVVEFQAFRGDRNEYLIKEFAAVDVNTNFSVVLLFASPYNHSRLSTKTQRSNDWLQTHYHRLRWDDGNVPYKDLIRTVVKICSRFSVVYTKGSEKATFLRQYHGNVIDLDDLFAPCSINKRTSIQMCPAPQHHQQKQPVAQCALYNALFYASWRRNCIASKQYYERDGERECTEALGM